MNLLILKCLLLLFSLPGNPATQTHILPTGPLSAGIGKSVTIEVLTKVNPNSTVILWNYSDGINQNNILTCNNGAVNVADEYVGRASIDKTNGFLTLTGLTAEDTGDYSISIVTSGTLTGEVRVNVLEPTTDVTIKSDSTEEKEGGTVVLECTAKGSHITFTWTNGSKPIVADGDRITMIGAELSSKLTVRDLYRSDFSNIIFCTAGNKLGMVKSRPFNLTVLYGPESVNLTPTKAGEVISSMEDFNLTCSANSKPSATFTWFFDDKQMKNTGPVLTLKTIKEEGLGKVPGNFKCKALNPKTTVTKDSSAIKLSVMEPIVGTKLTGPTTPLFVGNSTSLVCKEGAGTVEKREWLLNEQPIQGPRYGISNDATNLTISSLQKEDNAVFKCRLSNKVSQETKEVTLTVNYGPEEPTMEGSAEVEIDKPWQLRCSVASVPTPTYVWKLNNTVLAETSGVLKVPNAKIESSGTYTCVATNSVTGKTTTSSHVLSVKAEVYNGLSDGAIAGIVIGCLLAIAVAIGLVFYCRQKVPTSYTVPKGTDEP